jgi:hypothetical protein
MVLVNEIAAPQSALEFGSHPAATVVYSASLQCKDFARADGYSMCSRFHHTRTPTARAFRSKRVPASVLLTNFLRRSDAILI